MSVNKQAERDAASLLASLDITEAPVDPIAIAVRLGLSVWTSQLQPDLSGVLVKSGDSKPEIYLNAADSTKRQRFTCAHEIGHFFSRSRTASTAKAWNYLDYRNDLSANGTDQEEIYANGFAAALLMPVDLIHRYRESVGIGALAGVFGVSDAAMNFRLRNLGVQ